MNTPEKPSNKKAADFSVEMETALKEFRQVTKVAEATLANYVVPVRQSILKRFPALFALLVSFGATATFLGLERIIIRYQFLNDSPELILLLGITILVLTGRLYKKLS